VERADRVVHNHRGDEATAKIWFGDRPIAADASAKVFDLLEKQVTGLNDRR
jgi:hypothetical protein